MFPIFKGGSKEDPSNYRPISILNTTCISKIFEKHVSTQLHDFLKRKDILHKSQSGFRPGYSCQSALINMVQKWMTALDKGEIVGSVDFDLVDHDILFYKLKLYKFNDITLKWFTSYLENITQVVKVGDNVSAKQSIKTGVPQDSILGPLLFLLYINNLQHNVDQVAKWCKKNNMS